MKNIVKIILIILGGPLSITPILVEENPEAVRFFIEHHQKSHSIWQRGLSTLRRFFK